MIGNHEVDIDLEPEIVVNPIETSGPVVLAADNQIIVISDSLTPVKSGSGKKRRISEASGHEDSNSFFIIITIIINLLGFRCQEVFKIGN